MIQCNLSYWILSLLNLFSAIWNAPLRGLLTQTPWLKFSGQCVLMMQTLMPTLSCLLWRIWKSLLTTRMRELGRCLSLGWKLLCNLFGTVGLFASSEVLQICTRIVLALSESTEKLYLPRWSRTYDYTPKSKFRLTHLHRVSFWFEFQRARAAFMASRSAPADGRPVSDRQLGRVRKSLNERMWSAGFEFQQRGVRTAFDGPIRDTKAAAEIDRQFVAAAVSRVTRSSREHACKKALAALRTRSALALCELLASYER
jgi:hypothetical protein